MGAVAENDVLRGRVGELVLQAPPTLDSPHACVAERVELVRVLEERGVVVQWVRVRAHQGSCWDPGPVVERDIFQCDPWQGH